MSQATDGRESPYLTLKEATAYLKISRSTLYRLMGSGALRGRKAGGTWRFTRAALDATLTEPEGAILPSTSPAAMKGYGEHAIA